MSEMNLRLKDTIVSKKTDKWSRIYKHSENIVSRNIAGETILVPIRGNLADMQHIFTLNSVGVFIWDQLDGSKNLADVLDLLMEHFEVDRKQAEQDISDFLDQVVESGLAVEE